VAFAVELEDMRLKQIDAALALRWQIEGHHNNMTAQQIQEDRVAVEEVCHTHYTITYTSYFYMAYITTPYSTQDAVNLLLLGACVV
jgi:hypothetical protein